MMTFAVIGFAYLLGSISFAVVTAKLFGLPDPRTYGSRNPGATNVLRSGSKAAALVTLFGDALKGAVAVWLAAYFLSDSQQQAFGVAFAGLAAFTGHLYPVFFRFKGGKGVATALGILMAYNSLLGVSVLGLWLLVVWLTRYVSLASVLAAFSAAPLGALLGAGTYLTLALSLMGLLIIWRHFENLRRLRAGTESKIFSRKG